MESTMHDLSEKTTSVLFLDRVVENPEIPDVVFAPQSLATLEPLGSGANEQGR
jgi:hypothetical protein